jgi:hypothetical protein
MQPLYKIGESTAFGLVPSPFTVVSVEQEVAENGHVIERMVDSGDNLTVMDRGPEVHPVHATVHTERAGGIVVPYTRRQPDVEAALPPDAEWVDVSGSDFDYWRVLCDSWEPSFDLTLCEHDVVWRPDVSEAFDTCPEPWCVFPYDDHSPNDAEAWANMLGCTRFRKELIAAVPDAAHDVEERFRDWHYLCDGLGRILRAAGYTHHWHSPPVHHDHAD